MLIKVITALIFIITMSHISSIVPANIFTKNVNNTKNRIMLTIIDDAIINHFCNNSGKLPRELNELNIKSKDELVNFEYNIIDANTYALKIKNTNEYSANSSRDLKSNVFDFSVDDNGNSIYLGADATMWASIQYKYDKYGHIIGIGNVSCYTMYDTEGKELSDTYDAHFNEALTSSGVFNKLIAIFSEAKNIDTFAKACGMDSIFKTNLISQIAEDVILSWFK